MRNARPSGPLCGNCLMTQVYCEAVRDTERRACCGTCEHTELISLQPEPNDT